MIRRFHNNILLAKIIDDKMPSSFTRRKDIWLYPSIKGAKKGITATLFFIQHPNNPHNSGIAKESEISVFARV